MNSLEKIWRNLQDAETDIQIVNYWEHDQTKILAALREVDSPSGLPIAYSILHIIARALNNREKYSSVFYLFKAGFQPLQKLDSDHSEIQQEATFEFARGLHHIRKYDLSKQLFNKLAVSGFDTSRFEDWWDQTAFASSKERLWIKTDVLPYLIKVLIIASFISIAITTKAFILTTIIFLLIYELSDAYWYQYKVKAYLKEFERLSEFKEINNSLRKKILFELIVSLILGAVYLANKELLVPVAIVLSGSLVAFSYWLNIYKLPRLVGELNRKAAFSNVHSGDEKLATNSP